MKFGQAIRKIELLIKNIITVHIGRKSTERARANFWCDSHPTLCLTCIRTRHVLKGHKPPPMIWLNTKHGTYCWFKIQGQHGTITCFVYAPYPTTDFRRIKRCQLPFRFTLPNHKKIQLNIPYTNYALVEVPPH